MPWTCCYENSFHLRPLDHKVVCVQTGCEEDEEGRTIHLVVGNFTPITFQDAKEITIFVNEDLWYLHIPLLGTRETRYRQLSLPLVGGLP
jgi:hypothetical protein